MPRYGVTLYARRPTRLPDATPASSSLLASAIGTIFASTSASGVLGAVSIGVASGIISVAGLSGGTVSAASILGTGSATIVATSAATGSVGSGGPALYQWQTLTPATGKKMSDIIGPTGAGFNQAPWAGLSLRDARIAQWQAWSGGIWLDNNTFQFVTGPGHDDGWQQWILRMTMVGGVPEWSMPLAPPAVPSDNVAWNPAGTHPVAGHTYWTVRKLNGRVVRYSFQAPSHDGDAAPNAARLPVAAMNATADAWLPPATCPDIAEVMAAQGPVEQFYGIDSLIAYKGGGIVIWQRNTYTAADVVFYSSVQLNTSIRIMVHMPSIQQVWLIATSSGLLSPTIQVLPENPIPRGTVGSPLSTAIPTLSVTGTALSWWTSRPPTMSYGWSAAQNKLYWYDPESTEIYEMTTTGVVSKVTTTGAAYTPQAAGSAVNGVRPSARASNPGSPYGLFTSFRIYDTASETWAIISGNEAEGSVNKVRLA
jgi:hypothetical protein